MEIDRIKKSSYRRSVNNFFPEGSDPVKAAKALATILLTLRGTPFIYEGQELGCTNVSWDSIDDYDDIGSHGQYNLMLQEGLSPAQAMKSVHRFSRDNARTPMQWNSNKNAGFSTGKTWLPVNENYKTVNAEVEEKNSDSVLNWYRKLAQFRADNKILVEGDYKLLLPDSEEIFAFSRSLDGETLITAVNFTAKNVQLPKDFSDKKILVDSEIDADKNFLKPFEARIYKN